MLLAPSSASMNAGGFRRCRFVELLVDLVEKADSAHV